MPDFLFLCLFSTHCDAATLGCACWCSYTTNSSVLGHSYPKPISRNLQSSRHHTLPAAIAGDGWIGPTLVWIFQNRGSQPSMESLQLNLGFWSSPQSGAKSWVSFSIILCLFHTCPSPPCLTPLTASTFHVPDLVPCLTHSKSFWSLLSIILATCPKPKPRFHCEEPHHQSFTSLDHLAGKIFRI